MNKLWVGWCQWIWLLDFFFKRKWWTMFYLVQLLSWQIIKNIWKRDFGLMRGKTWDCVWNDGLNSNAWDCMCMWRCHANYSIYCSPITFLHSTPLSITLNHIFRIWMNWIPSECVSTWEGCNYLLSAYGVVVYHP